MSKRHPPKTTPPIHMEPVWVGRKLIEPIGWISPETRERMAQAQADNVADQKAMRERQGLPLKLLRANADKPSASPDRWPEDMR
jgi:hypothetical protein